MVSLLSKVYMYKKLTANLETRFGSCSTFQWIDIDMTKRGIPRRTRVVIDFDRVDRCMTRTDQ